MCLGIIKFRLGVKNLLCQLLIIYITMILFRVKSVGAIVAGIGMAVVVAAIPNFIQVSYWKIDSKCSKLKE